MFAVLLRLSLEIAADVGGLDEQGPEILAPALGDAAQDGSTARAVLAWHPTANKKKLEQSIADFVTVGLEANA